MNPLSKRHKNGKLIPLENTRMWAVAFFMAQGLNNTNKLTPEMMDAFLESIFLQPKSTPRVEAALFALYHQAKFKGRITRAMRRQAIRAAQSGYVKWSNGVRLLPGDVWCPDVTTLLRDYPWAADAPKGGGHE